MDKNGNDIYDSVAINKAMNEIKDMDDFYRLVYVSGGIVPYLYLGIPSVRKHEGLHFICEKQNMTRLRELVRKHGVYVPEWDSMSFETAEDDYGFCFKVADVPVEVFPFEVTAYGIKQNSYNCYNRECKSNLLPNLAKSDYISIYKTPMCDTLKARSLEVIAISKYLLNRYKDKIDFGYLSKCELDREKFDRVKESFVELRNKQDIYNDILFIEPTAKVKSCLDKKKAGFASSIVIIGSVVLALVVVVLYMMYK